MKKKIMCSLAGCLAFIWASLLSGGAVDVNSYYEANTGNVILNPGFEFYDSNRLPLFWYKRPYTQADVTVTKETQKYGDYSVCISNSDADFFLQNIAAIHVDYTFPYALEFWVKAEGATGTNYVEVETGRDGRLKRTGPGLVWDKLGVYRSENLTGTFEWKKVSLEILVPKYSMYVLIRLVSQGNKGKIYFDGLYLNGYGSAPVEIIMNQAGFHPDGLKDGLVRTKERYAGGSVELVTTGNETVYKSPLTYVKRHKFGEHYYRFDFSGFQKEGDYKLKVTLDEKTVCWYPDSFKIDRRIYKDLWFWCLKHLQHARCGFAVPGWFQAAYLDDAAVYTERFGGQKIGHQDVTGGWFDAGDVNKFNENCGIVTWELLKSWELLFEPEESSAQVNNDGIKEAEWGVKYLVKLYDGEAGFWGAVRDPNNTMRTPFWQNTDNIPNTPDDRIVFREQYRVKVMEGNREIILALAQYLDFCRRYRDKLSEAESCTTVRTVLPKVLPSSLAKPLNPRLYEDADPCLIPVGKLVREIDGAGDYGRKTKELAGVLEDQLRKKTYLQQGLTQKSPAAYFYKLVFEPSLPFHFVYFLLEYAELFPADDLTVKIKETVQRFIEEELVPLSQEGISPLGHTWFWDPLKHQGTDIISPNRNNIYQIGVAIVFAKAARVLKKKEYLDLAERNIAWILGRNYCAGSSLVGIGYRQLGCYAEWLLHTPGHENSYLPGGICKGIGVGDGRLNEDFQLLKQNPLAEKGPCMPEGFPFMHSFPSPDCPVYQTNGLTEVWIRTTGAFLLACGEIQKSLQKLKWKD